MSVTSRTEFIRTMTWESTALIFSLFLLWTLDFIAVALIYFFASPETDLANNFFISQAFEDWLFSTNLQLSLLIVFLWRYVDYKEKIENWKSEGERFSFKLLLLVGIGAGLIIVAYSYLHDFAVSGLLGNSFLPPDPWLAYKDSPLWERILLFTTGVFIAPVCEELFHREMIFGNILRSGFVKTGYVFSAIVFAVLHFNFPYLLLYFIDGLFLAFLYQKTRSILPCIVAHMTINILAHSFLIF